LVSVPLAVLVFVTTTFTAPPACAGVFAVIVVALTKTMFVAVVPPKVTVAPDWKPLPLIVTGRPPLTEPWLGVTDVTVTGGRPTLTFADFVSEHPADVVTVTCSVSVPAAPAVNVIAFVPVPAVIVPLVIDQL